MEKAGEILKELLDEGSFSNLRKSASLFQAWPRLVGDPLGSHSRIRDVENGWIVICVDHPGCYQSLHFHDDDILKKLRQKYPSLQIIGIKVWVCRLRNGLDERPAHLASQGNQREDVDLVVVKNAGHGPGAPLAQIIEVDLWDQIAGHVLAQTAHAEQARLQTG